jgi:hypothetical protein
MLFHCYAVTSAHDTVNMGHETSMKISESFGIRIENSWPALCPSLAGTAGTMLNFGQSNDPGPKTFNCFICLFFCLILLFVLNLREDNK